MVRPSTSIAGPAEVDDTPGRYLPKRGPLGAPWRAGRPQVRSGGWRKRRQPCRGSGDRPTNLQPMLDVRRFRTEFDVVRAGLARRGDDLSPLERVRTLDERQRELAAERDQIRARVNQISKEIGLLRRDGELEAAEVLQI